MYSIFERDKRLISFYCKGNISEIRVSFTRTLSTCSMLLSKCLVAGCETQLLEQVKESSSAVNRYVLVL
jgi:hypothetical protein